MTTPVISGDGIFSHVFLGAVDLQKSASFYDAALNTLGIRTSALSAMAGFCTDATSQRSSSPVLATVTRLRATE